MFLIFNLKTIKRLFRQYSEGVKRLIFVGYIIWVVIIGVFLIRGIFGDLNTWVILVFIMTIYPIFILTIFWIIDGFKKQDNKN